MGDTGGRSCTFLSKCPVFKNFASHGAGRVFQIHFCHGAYESCERYKSASKGVEPPLNLLPDGSELRTAPKGGKL